MRLIDADALITWFNDHYDDEEFSVGYISGLIKDAPTVDIPTVDIPTVDAPTVESQRIKGRWVEPTQEDIWERRAGSCECLCSICGKSGLETDNFCWNCGADMGNDANDELKDYNFCPTCGARCVKTNKKN